MSFAAISNQIPKSLAPLPPNVLIGDPTVYSSTHSLDLKILQEMRKTKKLGVLRIHPQHSPPTI
jgi:hypothetical protein